MVQRVYEQAVQCHSLTHVLVATDDQRIEEPLKEAGIPVVMTSTKHNSGTERCIEVVSGLKERYGAIINIQGDEPFIDPLQINELSDLLKMGAEIASLMKKMDDEERLFDPNVVKVVVDEYYKALYFSRSPIPFQRDTERGQWLTKQNYYQHVGIYGYRLDALMKIKTMSPSKLEQSESLEQLRWLANGMMIKMGVTDYDSQGIDTPEDLKKALDKYLEDE